MLSDALDKYGEPGVAIDFSISPRSRVIFAAATKQFDELLTNNGVQHSSVEDSVHTRKFEDEYHPFALYSDFDSVEEYFTQFDNMLHCCPEKFYHKVSCLFESSSGAFTGSSGLL